MIAFHTPAGILSNYVDIMVYSNFIPGHSIERLIPDGSVNLIFELGDEPQYIFDNESLRIKKEYKAVWLSGIQQNYISISSGTTSMCVIQFNPAGSHSILHIPLSELTNRVIPAELVLGKSILELREKMMAGSDPNEIFSTVEDWILGRLKSETLHEQVVQFVTIQTWQDPSRNSIEELMNKTGYSHRHFIQLFKKYVGLSPKQYQRIVRFNKVLQSIENGDRMDWSAISIDCGFYDQAHFIKEFKFFSGFSPRDFMQEKGEYINYVPIQ